MARFPGWDVPNVLADRAPGNPRSHVESTLSRAHGFRRRRSGTSSVQRIAGRAQLHLPCPAGFHGPATVHGRDGVRSGTVPPLARARAATDVLAPGGMWIALGVW